MKYETKQKIYKTIMLIVLVAVITFISTTFILYNKLSGENQIKYVMVGNGTNDNSLLYRLKTVVDKYYIGEYDEKKMNEYAAKGYIAGLGDEYSEYILEEEYEEFYNDVSGSFEGIGIYFGKTKDNKMIVISPIANSAAEKAGMKSGDIIVKVDDLVVQDETTSTEVSNKIKGEVGTNVKIEVLRDDEPMTFNIIRENVKLHYVESKILENGIGYLGFLSFDSDTAEEFRERLEELLKQNIKSLIIDLRENGGGIVEEATNIADYLLPKNKIIVKVKDKEGKEEITYSNKTPITDIPIVVLVDNNTASSAEILCSALQDNGRAKLVGTTTYGKGVIQKIYKLVTGGALKLTTNKYYTALGNEINKIGIVPDEIIELPEEQTSYTVTEEEDTQLQKAIELLK